MEITHPGGMCLPNKNRFFVSRSKNNQTYYNMYRIIQGNLFLRSLRNPIFREVWDLILVIRIQKPKKHFEVSISITGLANYKGVFLELWNTISREVLISPDRCDWDNKT